MQQQVATVAIGCSLNYAVYPVRNGHASLRKSIECACSSSSHAAGIVAIDDYNDRW